MYHGPALHRMLPPLRGRLLRRPPLRQRVGHAVRPRGQARKRREVERGRMVKHNSGLVRRVCGMCGGPFVMVSVYKWQGGKTTHAVHVVS